MSTESTQFWEKRYQEADPAWGTRPNAVFAEVVPELCPEPGRALDLGCGHGGDARWLAARGWLVTAVDVSPTALGRIAEAAEAEGLVERITLACHDLSRSFPEGAFDLVSASYFHSPVEFPREQVLRRAAEAVLPGGLLLVVDHGSAAPWSWNREQVFPTPRETADGLALGPGWHIERLDSPRRTAAGPDGQVAEVADNVIALRRER
ncbi:class I SAM-dependent methyltransferase [Amycolatopsis sp. PS_44_ISF1]|uniref:class I SAM-dependent methyltransferase n=1 Tax=Amycolatopsis sp. PS_44_ISF1 TaxID=2974917 RepID=UPI0028E06082|nr:class I SAM-dependent methyltransferase [Amycolatopsis sp. PS_44_ISF1]MDT8915442.1 class I SAM-dependent methyltransferase [Amycolatopsis sp. PS_44_ISF1]